MIIDSHAHAWSSWPYEPAVPDAASRGRVEQLLWEMDRANVEHAVIVSAQIENNPENNAYGADCIRRYPDRLSQFGDVDSRWSDTYHTAGAAERLAKLHDQLDLAGVTHYLAPQNDGWLASDDGLAFFSEAEQRGLIMSIAGPPIWQADLRQVAQTCPDLTILCHHLAGVPSTAKDRQAGLDMVLASADTPNIYIKASGFYYGSEEPYAYPHPEGVAIFQSLVSAFGAHRFVWGSDYPVAPMRAYTFRQSLEIVRKHCDFLSPQELEAVLGGTLAALLGLSPAPTSHLQGIF